MTRLDFNFAVDGRCGIQTQKLDYNWTLRCIGTSNIGIERKFSGRDVLITGKLETKLLDLTLIGVKSFRDVLRFGKTFLNLTPTANHIVNLEGKLIINGYVIIQENRDKQNEGLRNERSKQSNQQKPLESRESRNGIYQKFLEKLSYDFERLIDQKMSSFSDVTLKCGKATIPDKSILSARSPVFAAMFANPMREGTKNEVDISDVDAPTVRALLMYMYTGKTDFTNASTTDLLLAADKYQLIELKGACCDFLKDTVSMQNVLRILVLGDMIDADLKSFAVHYICSKSADFSALESTEEWETLQTERPALSIEILTSMVKSKNEKYTK